MMNGEAIVTSRKTKVANNGAIDAINGRIGCSGYLLDCQSPATEHPFQHCPTEHNEVRRGGRLEGSSCFTAVNWPKGYERTEPRDSNSKVKIIDLQ